jgi:capsular exopolysaccharide synthesis family protein
MANSFPPVEEPELNFNKLFQVLRRRRKTIRGTTAGFLFLSLLYGFFWPATYQSVTTVKVPDSSQTATNALREMAFLPASGDPIETYMQVAAADKVALGVIDALKLRSDPKLTNVPDAKLIWYLHHQVIIDNVKRSNLISIAGRAKTAREAADLANAWAQSFIQVSQDLNQEAAQAHYLFIHKQLQAIRDKIAQDKENKRNFLNQSNESEADELVYKSLLAQDEESRIQANNQNTGIVVVDPAAPSDKAGSPKKIPALILGLLAGIFVGLSAVFIQEWMEDRIHEEEDLTHPTRSVLWAKIPWAPAEGPAAPSPADLFISQSRFQNSSYLQGFKVFRSHLLLARPETGCLAVGILSPGEGEGRTLANVNLALILAQAGKKVLLIDADLENPKVGVLFGLETSASPGLSRLLSGQASLKDAVKPSGVANLSLLPAPPDSADLSGLLSPGALKKWVAETKPKFDFILFDGPPLLVSPDSAVFATALDGVVLLARFGKTRRPDILKAVQQLQAAHVPIWGTVLNGVAGESVPWGQRLTERRIPRSKNKTAGLKT